MNYADDDVEEVHLNTAKSGVYEVVYVDARSTFQAIHSTVALNIITTAPPKINTNESSTSTATTTQNQEHEAEGERPKEHHQIVYTGGLIAAFSAVSGAGSSNDNNKNKKTKESNNKSSSSSPSSLLLSNIDTRGSIPHGKGKLLYDDTGEYYEGEWYHGMRHGKGIWKSAPRGTNAPSLDASSMNQQPPTTTTSAAASTSDSSGATHHQQHLHQQTSPSSAAHTHTHAPAALPDRSVYEGEWRFDTRHGKGIEQFLDGRVYNGEFTNNKCHGQGSMTFVNNDCYRGIFVDGKPHDAKGEYSFANGDSLIGPFVDGKRHGTFSVSYAQSAQHTYSATFLNDAIAGAVACIS